MVRHLIVTALFPVLLSTGCPGPGSDRPSSLRELNASSPVIAVSGKSVLAGWVQTDTSSQNTYPMTAQYAQYSAWFGSAWGWFYHAMVDNNQEGQTSLFQVAVSEDNSKFAAWYKISSNGGRIYVNRIDGRIGASWETPQTLTDSVTVLDLAIAADAHGNAIIVWIQMDSFYSRVYARRYRQGVGWDPVQTVDDNIGNCEDPRIAVDVSGNALVVWQQGSGSSTSIYANWFNPSAGWGSAQMISNGSGAAYSPDLAMNSSGIAMAVWYQNDASVYNAYARRYTPSLGWDTSELMESGSENAYAVRVGIDNTGVAVAVWRQPDIYFKRYVPSTGWGAEQLIAQGFVDHVSIAVNAQGKVITAWNQWNPSGPNPGDALVYARKFDPATGWETEKVLTSEPGSADAPHAVIDSEGRATVIWSQSGASGGSVFSNTY